MATKKRKAVRKVKGVKAKAKRKTIKRKATKR